MSPLVPILHSWAAWGSEAPLPASRDVRGPGEVWKEYGFWWKDTVRPTPSSIQTQQRWDCRHSKSQQKSQSIVAHTQQITFRVTLSTFNSSLFKDKERWSLCLALLFQVLLHKVENHDLRQALPIRTFSGRV